MTLQCDEHSDLKVPDTHRGLVKKSSKKACLKCNERDGVLVCTSDDCPIVLHKECMSCAAYFDGKGNFYCPYCAYKRSLRECHKAKEFLILTKKALASFLDSKVVNSTGDVQTAGSSKRERPDVSGFTLQKDICQNGLSINMEVPKKPVEIGGSRSGRVSEGTIDLKSLNDDHNLVTDNVLPVRQESENLKRQKIAVELEGLTVQRKQTRIEPHGSTVCSAGHDAMDIDESSDKTDTATLQDEYTSCEQLKVNSEDADQPAEIQRGQCDDPKTVVRSSKNDACHAGKSDAPVTLKESGIFLEKHIESNDVGEVCREVEEKDQQPVEASTGHGVNKTPVMGDVTANRATVNSENTCFEEHASCRTRKCNESMTHTEAVNMASRNQQDQNAMDGNYDGLPKKVHKQSDPREPTEVMNDKAGDTNCTLHEVENISVGDMAVNKNIAGDSHCRRANEGLKQVELQKNDVNSVSKENPGLLHEELDTRDENKPSEESHRTGHRIRRNREGTQPSKSPRYCESDLEDFEEATHVKSRQKVDSRKQIQHQHPPGFISRRKKLPWTKAEEEMLKEGVDKFSLIAKKNLPWVRILQFGSHIFDGTRTPEDLKDKWKRILSKAHANAAHANAT